MSFEFLNRPPQPSGLGAPIPMQYYASNPNQYVPQQQQPYPVINVDQNQQQQSIPYVKPTITMENKLNLSIIDDTNEELPNTIHTKTTIINDEDKPKRKRKSTELTLSSNGNLASTDKAESANGSIIEEVPTSYTYYETTDMLRGIIRDTDSINGALLQEFQMARASRTLKNKYSVLVGLSENISSLMSNKINAIKEINSSISKSNELDYKKAKDVKAAQANMNDDAYIADLYKAYISNPQNALPMPNIPVIDTTVYGNPGIVRASIRQSDINSSQPVDTSYLNYVSNMTPEQRLMQYEGNPNVKQCVVYDASTGNKWFEYMDMTTGQAIPNMPTYDANIMMDTTLDLKNRVAKNININETFPLYVINDHITSEY